MVKIEPSFKDNPKLFWSYHKAFLGNRSSIQAILSYKGETAEKPAAKAKLLKKYFSSVFRPASDVNIAQICISNLQLADIEVSVDEVRDHLKNLDTSKPSGHNGIPARLVKECGDQIVPTLGAIFNQSLGSAKLPSKWISADIVPIHKKDSKEPAEYYRPVSLLLIANKVLEHCVINRLYEHLKCLRTDPQHGFLKN